MTIFISRANYALLTAGMNATERQGLAATVTVYPDGPPDEITIDQDRIAARFADLLADEYRAPRAELPPPWRQLSTHFWVAPAHTPPPDPNLRVFSESVNVNDMAQAAAHLLREENRQAFLNRWTNINQPEREPARLEAGEHAAAALTTTAPPTTGRGGPKGTGSVIAWLAHSGFIQIVLDTDLPPDVWRLVDPTSRDVLHEARLESVADLEQVAREHTAEMAEALDIPLGLLTGE